MAINQDMRELNSYALVNNPHHAKKYESLNKLEKLALLKKLIDVTLTLSDPRKNSKSRDSIGRLVGNFQDNFLKLYGGEMSQEEVARLYSEMVKGNGSILDKSLPNCEWYLSQAQTRVDYVNTIKAETKGFNEETSMAELDRYIEIMIAQYQAAYKAYNNFSAINGVAINDPTKLLKYIDKSIADFEASIEISRKHGIAIDRSVEITLEELKQMRGDAKRVGRMTPVQVRGFKSRVSNEKRKMTIKINESIRITEEETKRIDIVQPPKRGEKPVVTPKPVPGTTNNVHNGHNVNIAGNVNIIVGGNGQTKTSEPEKPGISAERLKDVKEKGKFILDNWSKANAVKDEALLAELNTIPMEFIRDLKDALDRNDDKKLAELAVVIFNNPDRTVVERQYLVDHAASIVGRAINNISAQEKDKEKPVTPVTPTDSSNTAKPDKPKRVRPSVSTSYPITFTYTVSPEQAEMWNYINGFYDAGQLSGGETPNPNQTVPSSPVVGDDPRPKGPTSGDDPKPNPPSAAAKKPPVTERESGESPVGIVPPSDSFIPPADDAGFAGRVDEGSDPFKPDVGGTPKKTPSADVAGGDKKAPEKKFIPKEIDGDTSSAGLPVVSAGDKEMDDLIEREAEKEDPTAGETKEKKGFWRRLGEGIVNGAKAVGKWAARHPVLAATIAFGAIAMPISWSAAIAAIPKIAVYGTIGLIAGNGVKAAVRGIVPGYNRFIHKYDVDKSQKKIKRRMKKRQRLLEKLNVELADTAKKERIPIPEYTDVPVTDKKLTKEMAKNTKNINAALERINPEMEQYSPERIKRIQRLSRQLGKENAAITREMGGMEGKFDKIRDIDDRMDRDDLAAMDDAQRRAYFASGSYTPSEEELAASRMAAEGGRGLRRSKNAEADYERLIEERENLHRRMLKTGTREADATGSFGVGSTEPSTRRGRSSDVPTTEVDDPTTTSTTPSKKKKATKSTSKAAERTKKREERKVKREKAAENKKKKAAERAENAELNAEEKRAKAELAAEENKKKKATKAADAEARKEARAKKRAEKAEKRKTTKAEKTKKKNESANAKEFNSKMKALQPQLDRALATSSTYAEYMNKVDAMGLDPELALGAKRLSNPVSFREDKKAAQTRISEATATKPAKKPATTTAPTTTRKPETYQDVVNDILVSSTDYQDFAKKINALPWDPELKHKAIQQNNFIVYEERKSIVKKQLAEEEVKRQQQEAEALKQEKEKKQRYEDAMKSYRIAAKQHQDHIDRIIMNCKDFEEFKTVMMTENHPMTTLGYGIKRIAIDEMYNTPEKFNERKNMLMARKERDDRRAADKALQDEIKATSSMVKDLFEKSDNVLEFNTALLDLEANKKLSGEAVKYYQGLYTQESFARRDQKRENIAKRQSEKALDAEIRENSKAIQEIFETAPNSSKFKATLNDMQSKGVLSAGAAKHFADYYTDEKFAKRDRERVAAEREASKQATEEFERKGKAVIRNNANLIDEMILNSADYRSFLDKLDKNPDIKPFFDIAKTIYTKEKFADRKQQLLEAKERAKQKDANAKLKAEISANADGVETLFEETKDATSFYKKLDEMLARGLLSAGAVKHFKEKYPESKFATRNEREAQRIAREEARKKKQEARDKERAEKEAQQSIIAEVKENQAIITEQFASSKSYGEYVLRIRGMKMSEEAKTLAIQQHPEHLFVQHKAELAKKQPVAQPKPSQVVVPQGKLRKAAEMIITKTFMKYREEGIKVYQEAIDKTVLLTAEEKEIAKRMYPASAFVVKTKDRGGMF